MLACDGIWDVTTEEAAATQVRKLADPKRICSLAYTLGSHDNLSAMIISLNEPPSRSSPMPSDATHASSSLSPPLAKLSHSISSDNFEPRRSDQDDHPAGSARPWTFGHVG